MKLSGLIAEATIQMPSIWKEAPGWVRIPQKAFGKFPSRLRNKHLHFAGQDGWTWSLTSFSLLIATLVSDSRFLDHATLISEDRTKDIPSCSLHVLTDGVGDAGDAEGASRCMTALAGSCAPAGLFIRVCFSDSSTQP